MDRLTAMQIFVRVAERGNFSAVAQEMGVARSVVTRQVAALEALLGAKLLARSTRRLSITSAGAAYLEKCRVILNLVDAAETDVHAEREAPRGAIRLSVPLAFGIRHIAPLLLEFTKRHPEVTVDADYSDRRSNILEEGLDLVVRITRTLAPGDIARRLGASRMLIVASPDYIARHGEPATPSELISHECLGYTSGRDAQGWAFLIDGQPQRFPVRGRLLANNGDVLLQAAIEGFGIACEPAFICAEALAAGRLLQLLKKYPQPELGIHAVLPSNRHVPHRVRVLLDFLAERLGADPPWESAAIGRVKNVRTASRRAPSPRGADQRHRANDRPRAR